MRWGVGVEAGGGQAAGGRAGTGSPDPWGPAWPCSLAHWDHGWKELWAAGEKLELARCMSGVLRAHQCNLQAHVPAVGLRRAQWTCSFVPGEETSRAFLSPQNIFPSTSFRPRPLKALQQCPRAPRTSRSPRSPAPQHLPVQGLVARGPSTPSRVPNGPKSPKAPAQLKQLPLTKQQMAKTPSKLALGPGLLCFLGEEARMVSARPWLEDSTARLVQQTGATVRGLAGRALSLIAAGIVIVMSFGGAWLPEALTGALRICAHSSHDS